MIFKTNGVSRKQIPVLWTHDDFKFVLGRTAPDFYSGRMLVDFMSLGKAPCPPSCFLDFQSMIPHFVNKSSSLNQ